MLDEYVELDTYTTDNKFTINELRIVVNPKYFGPVPNGLICYLNDVVAENCTSENEIIYIRERITLNDHIVVGLYGYNVPRNVDFEKENSFILVNLDDRKTFSRDTWLYGKTKLSEAFDTSVFVGESSNKANLRVYST